MLGLLLQFFTLTTITQLFTIDTNYIICPLTFQMQLCKILQLVYFMPLISLMNMIVLIKCPTLVLYLAFCTYTLSSLYYIYLKSCFCSDKCKCLINGKVILKIMGDIKMNNDGLNIRS